MTKYRLLLLTISICTVTTACSVGEEYTKPQPTEIKTWSSKEKSMDIAGNNIDPLWWRSLKDTTLNRLIDEAVKENLDIKIAEARLDEAKALTGRASSSLLPDINVTSSNAIEGNQGSRGGLNDTNKRSEIGISGTWDLDIFGSRREELQASKANLGNTEANLRQTMQTLVADLASTYIDMRAAQQLLLLTEKNLKLQQETLRATKIQFEAKAAAKLDVLRSQAQVSNTQAEIENINATIKAKQHRIAILMGKPPQDIDSILIKPSAIPFFTDKILLQTPIWVIANRPDIQAAEFRLIEQTALKNARTADLFPKLSLSGFFGIGTASFYTNTTPWTLGANLIAPLLNFGRLESEIEAADARKMQALHRYRKTVLEALEEVENALTQYSSQRKRLVSLEESSSSQQEAARMARLKYDAGDAIFIDVLIAEEHQLQAESAVVQAKASVTKSAIDLYTAMGIVAPWHLSHPAHKE